MVGVSWFNSFISNIEMRLSLSLGRKLAHAASETEEFFLINQNRRKLGSNIERWQGLSEDRKSRGLGDIEVINQSFETANILVNRFSSGPMEAGILASSWEFAKKKRYKFRWSDSGGVLLVDLELDDITVPIPEEMTFSWSKGSSEVIPSDVVRWEDVRELELGGWELDGDRKAMIHRDLILRFEEFSIHNIQSLTESRSEDYNWELAEGKRALWWTALADTSRHLFMESKRHVMISEAKDWISVSIRNLSSYGLGMISDPEIDLETGELNATLIGTFHPAISGGIILGCWERSTGSKGRVTVSLDDGKLRVKISPKRPSPIRVD
ncbi:MAG: hypothetical protein CMA62_00645 [Euryarchaeota archaeon]|nr:hypothetical protein [Euryarchaeota archaeon]|tara:strand:- start:36 stop:1010 length:975 start_codon:yes stop_codon:yes gene_type:complete